MWRHTATSIHAKARGITVPNLVIRSRFCVHGPSCTSLVLCARLARFSDSVSALGAEVLVTCSVTTWKALQPSTILKWPLLFPAAAWYNQQVTLHDVRIFFPAWHSIASSTWKESHWDALVVMTTIIFRWKNYCFSCKSGGKQGSSLLLRQGKRRKARETGTKLKKWRETKSSMQARLWWTGCYSNKHNLHASEWFGRNFPNISKHFPYLYWTLKVLKVALGLFVRYLVYCSFCVF